MLSGLPTGKAVVLKVATPELFSTALPMALKEPLTKKLTVPRADAGVIVTVKVTFWPRMTLPGSAVNVMLDAVRPAAHATARALASTEPRPVTSL
jgi:hypothetical protein